MNNFDQLSASDYNIGFDRKLDVFISSCRYLHHNISDLPYNDSFKNYSSSYSIAETLVSSEQDGELWKRILLSKLRDCLELGIIFHYCECNGETHLIALVEDRKKFISFYQQLGHHINNSFDDHQICHIKSCVSLLFYRLKLGMVYYVPQLLGLDYRYVGELGFTSLLSPDEYFERYCEVRELLLCWDDFMHYLHNYIKQDVSLGYEVKKWYEYGILHEMLVLSSLYHSIQIIYGDISEITMYDFGKLCSSSYTSLDDRKILCLWLIQLKESLSVSMYSLEAKEYLLRLITMMNVLITKEIIFHEDTNHFDEDGNSMILSQYYEMRIELLNIIDLIKHHY